MQAPHAEVDVQPKPKMLVSLLALALLLLLAWHLADVLLLVFGSIVFATAFASVGGFLGRVAKVPARFQIAASVIVVTAALAGFGWFVGDALTEQLSRLRQLLPQAWQQLQGLLDRYPAARDVLQGAQDQAAGSLSIGRIASLASLTVGAVASMVLMLILSIYLAADPRLYFDGLLKLIPPAHRDRYALALEGSVDALARWLLAQGVSMLFLGAATAIGLRLIGAPLALALGVITAVLGFVPFFGSIAGGVICTLIGLTDSPHVAMYVALMFLGVQMVQDYVLSPIIQRKLVSLPPALTLTATMVFGVLFGTLGVIFATPLLVVLMHLTKALYVDAHPAPGPI